MDRRTDGRTEAIAVPPAQMRSVIIRQLLVITATNICQIFSKTVWTFSGFKHRKPFGGPAGGGLLQR